MNLKDALLPQAALDQLVAWVEFKKLKFQIRYVNRAALTALAEASVVTAFNARAKGRERTIDPDKFAEGLAKLIIINWDGVTMRALAQVMPVDLAKVPAEQLDEPIQFSNEDMKILLTQVPDLDGFLQDCAMDIVTFRSPEERDLTKN